MDKNEIINRVLLKLKNLDEICSRMVDSEKIPNIEVDLLIDKTRFLYDDLIILQKLNRDFGNENIEIETFEEKEIIIEKEAEIPNKSKDEVLFRIEDTETETKPAKEEIIENEIQSDEKEIIKEPEPVEIPKQVKVKEPKASKKSYVSDSIAPHTQSMNDKLAENVQQHNLAEKINQKPVNSIQNAIMLNDKFLFIRELFGGMSDEYSITVNNLNNMSSFEEAKDYISKRFDWDMDDTVVIKFMEIVNRRFI